MRKFYKILILVLLFPYISFSKDIRIVAKVNNEIITSIDLEGRLLMAMELSNIPDREEIRNQLKDQVLKVLVEENLKIQEATRLGLFITSEELENAIRMLENRLGFEENTLIKNYASKNIPEITNPSHIKRLV